MATVVPLSESGNPEKRQSAPEGCSDTQADLLGGQEEFWVRDLPALVEGECGRWEGCDPVYREKQRTREGARKTTVLCSSGEELGRQRVPGAQDDNHCRSSTQGTH